MKLYIVAWEIDPEDYNQTSIMDLIIGVYTDHAKARAAAQDFEEFSDEEPDPDETTCCVRVYEVMTDD